MDDIELDLLERLVEVKKAISTVLNGGQSYKIGNQEYKRADLNSLYKLEKELTMRYYNTNYTHRAYIGWSK